MGDLRLTRKARKHVRGKTLATAALYHVRGLSDHAHDRSAVDVEREREACAVECDLVSKMMRDLAEDDHQDAATRKRTAYRAETAEGIARAIRARGNTQERPHAQA